ncbi:MAG TPA: glutamate racemase [Armatimonadota bacterium]|jgi:glutamate racemase
MHPIGLFDSGLGGLSVARVLFKRLPHEPLWVVGDTAHVPYGGRPLRQVRDFAMGLTQYLVDEGCRAVVMACNISSAVALEDARLRFAVPVFGMVEAGARAAAIAGESGPIGVLATAGTVESGAYTAAISALRPGASVLEIPCPRFVPLVESARWDSDEARCAASDYATPLVEAGVDTVILGCTHYPFLAKAIRAAFPYPIRLIDPADSVAADLENVLDLSPASGPPVHRFEATGDLKAFSEAGSTLLSYPFVAAHCPVWDAAAAGGHPLAASSR